MISPQLQAAAARTFVMVMGIIVAGLVPLYPQIIGNAPLDKNAMLRAFAGGVVGAVIARFAGEGVYDSIRANKVNAGNLAGLNDADVGAPHVQAHLSRVIPTVTFTQLAPSAPSYSYRNVIPGEPSDGYKTFTPGAPIVATEPLQAIPPLPEGQEPTPHEP